jgi:DNA-binding response OmpR family regulator
MRVLVIESDPSIAGLLADLLADEGHAAAGAATMDGGLTRAQAEMWDVCVTDGFWPVADAQSRAYLADLGSCCPVIVLSGRDWARRAQPAELGVTAVVPKPFDLDDLLDALETVTHARTVTPPCATAAAARSSAV